MRTILHLTCSPKGPSAYSRLVADELVARLSEANPAAKIVHRDLAADPPPLPNAAFSAAVLSGAAADDPAFAASETLIGELEACDALVIGTPMHNYAVPAVLKAWIDQIVRIRRTFQSTPAGKIGTLRDRPVFVVVASGGWFTGPSPTGTPAQPDFLTPYLRAALGTIGLTGIAFVTLEGLARGADPVEHALAAARARIAALIPAPPMH
ncbi:MAG TPA: NAD(P)H-dependent oxidoreductase [Acetobacteraceae bacterium]|jgi:FMN-dependent NADH-azoreductase